MRTDCGWFARYGTALGSLSSCIVRSHLLAARELSLCRNGSALLTAHFFGTTATVQGLAVARSTYTYRRARLLELCKLGV